MRLYLYMIIRNNRGSVFLDGAGIEPGAVDTRIAAPVLSRP